MMAQAAQQGVDTSQMPQEYSEQAARGALNGLMTLDEALKAQGQVALNAQRTMADEGAGTQSERERKILIYSDPASNPEWADIWLSRHATMKVVQDAFGNKRTTFNPPDPQVAAKAKAAGLPEAGSIRPQEEVVQTPQEANQQKRADEIDNEFRKYMVASQEYIANLDKAAELVKSKTGVNDVAAIQTVQRLIDPKGVVRGEDVEMLSTTAGARGKWDVWVQEASTGGKVSQSTRDQMTALVDTMQQQFRRQYQRTEAIYQQAYQDAMSGRSILSPKPAAPTSYVPPGTAPAGSMVNGVRVPGAARAALRGGQ
jgi:hypothetical protein